MLQADRTSLAVWRIITRHHAASAAFKRSSAAAGRQQPLCHESNRSSTGPPLSATSEMPARGRPSARDVFSILSEEELRLLLKARVPQGGESWDEHDDEVRLKKKKEGCRWVPGAAVCGVAHPAQASQHQYGLLRSPASPLCPLCHSITPTQPPAWSTVPPPGATFACCAPAWRSTPRKRT